MILDERIQYQNQRILDFGLSDEYMLPTEADELVDLNEMYLSYKAALFGSGWKTEPQKFQRRFLSGITELKHELINRTYGPQPGSEFILNERGKIRFVHGGRMRDRVVGHWICDYKINPAIQPYLIYNNGASQKGKGLSFARQEFESDLHSYFIEYETNEGFVGFVDMSKFYDNLRHSVAKEIIHPHIDEFSFEIFEAILDTFVVDVSYMTEEEYDRCLDDIFNSIWYHANISEEQKTGQKFMAKSADIGNQISQSIGMFYPMRVDNYAKIVKGCKRYGRYMDDIYIIGPTQEYVQDIIDGLNEVASEIGLFINSKKTRIVKLSGQFKYLQIKYSLTETGKLIKKINPKGVTRERRKMKAYKRLLDRGILQYHDVELAVKSWMGVFASLMSKEQIKHMKALYKELYGKELIWKQQN